MYKEDKTDPFRATKCAAVIYDGFLAVRHYDLLARVYDEAGFAEYCLREQNDVGSMGFETVSGRVYYEIATLCTEGIPTVAAIEFLNRMADKHLFERSGEFYRLTRIVDPFGTESRFCGDLPESTPKVDPVPDGALEKAARKNPVKKTTMRITGKRLEEFAVYTVRLCIGQMRLFSQIRRLRLALCRQLYGSYEQMPLAVSLEGEGFNMKVQIVADGGYTAPDETPRPLWIDMENRRIKVREDGDWMPLSEIGRVLK